MIVSALQRAGFATLEAENVEDAYRMVDSGTISLILLDWMLPGLSGLEFARRLKRADWTRNLPIVMITSRTGEKHRQRAMELGVRHYLGKPYQESDLLEHIYDVLAEQVSE